jgi:hypothetical protein
MRPEVKELWDNLQIEITRIKLITQSTDRELITDQHEHYTEWAPKK